MDILSSLVLLFIIVNIVQTVLILKYKLLFKRAILIGLIELFEFPLLIYLLLNGRVKVFMIIIMIEIVEWLVVSYFSIKTDNYQKKK